MRDAQVQGQGLPILLPTASPLLASRICCFLPLRVAVLLPESPLTPSSGLSVVCPLAPQFVYTSFKLSGSGLLSSSSAGVSVPAKQKTSRRQQPSLSFPPEGLHPTMSVPFSPPPPFLFLLHISAQWELICCLLSERP